MGWEAGALYSTTELIRKSKQGSATKIRNRGEQLDAHADHVRGGEGGVVSHGVRGAKSRPAVKPTN